MQYGDSELLSTFNNQPLLTCFMVILGLIVQNNIFYGWIVEHEINWNQNIMLECIQYLSNISSQNFVTLCYQNTMLECSQTHSYFLLRICDICFLIWVALDCCSSEHLLWNLQWVCVMVMKKDDQSIKQVNGLII